MASQVRAPNALANFKRPRAERNKEKNRDKRADRPGNSEDHLKCIRQLPCVCCGVLEDRSDPHHLLSTGTKERGMGLRSPDRWSVPVCRFHHDELHRIGTKGEARFFRGFGYIAIVDLAAALWMVTGDLEKMRRVIVANKQQCASQQKDRK